MFGLHPSYMGYSFPSNKKLLFTMNFHNVYWSAFNRRKNKLLKMLIDIYRNFRNKFWFWSSLVYLSSPVYFTCATSTKNQHKQVSTKVLIRRSSRSGYSSATSGWRLAAFFTKHWWQTGRRGFEPSLSQTYFYTKYTNSEVYFHTQQWGGGSFRSVCDWSRKTMLSFLCLTTWCGSDHPLGVIYKMD